MRSYRKKGAGKTLKNGRIQMFVIKMGYPTTIFEVEVAKANKETLWMGGRKIPMWSEEIAFYPTWDVAYAELLRRAERRVKNAQKAYERYKEADATLQEVKELKWYSKTTKEWRGTEYFEKEKKRGRECSVGNILQMEN